MKSTGFKLCVFGVQLVSMMAWGKIRVENGVTVPASNGLARSVARMEFNGGGTCSASFLTPTVLVTASHCTHGVSASSVRIKARDTKGAWHSAKVAKLYTNPSYKIEEVSDGVRVRNDIAIIRLAQALPIQVRPLKIVSADYLVGVTAPVTVVGYGMSGPSTNAGTLRRGTMDGTVEPLDNFFNRKGLLMTQKSSYQVVCPGDSGGAVLKGDSTSLFLIGVNSLSSGCQGDPEPSSMSEIAHSHIAWIKKVAPEVP